MTGIFFEVNGVHVAAKDCSWLMYAPCGCMSGCSVVDDESLTPEQAWKGFTPNAEQRRRDQAAGFVVKMGLHSDVVQLMEACKHEPQWGFVKTTLPDGHEWAAPATSSRPGRKHIAPKDRPDSGSTKALCGQAAWSWGAEWWHIQDLPECLPCVKRTAKAGVSDGNAS